MKEYRTCPDCGDNLDAGEHCKCREIEDMLCDRKEKTKILIGGIKRNTALAAGQHKA